MQQHHRLRQPGAVLADHQRVGTELLTESHRHGILQLGTTHLEDVVELVSLRSERRLQHLHRLEQRVRREDDRDLDGCRVDVVGRLAEVDVLVGVDRGVVALLVPHQLKRAVGDDLVGVHVGRGAGAALHHVDHELVVQRALADLLACATDGLVPLIVEQPQVVVGCRGGLLDGGERLDEVRAHPDLHAGDGEVLQRPQGVYTPVDVGGDLAVTDQIVFGTRDNRHVRLQCMRHDVGPHRPTLGHRRTARVSGITVLASTVRVARKLAPHSDSVAVWATPRRTTSLRSAHG